MRFFRQMADYGFFLVLSSAMYWLMGRDPTLEGIFGGGLFLLIISAVGVGITFLMRKKEV